MRLLFVSEFLPRWNSGAAGSILSIGESLEARGHRVEYLWKDSAPGLLPHPRLQDLFELPARQMTRVSQALRAASYDAVVISQPYAYLAYERLSRQFPATLFLNRTHGWEDRMAESWRRFRWREPSTFERPILDLSAKLVGRACERTVRACDGVIAPSELCANYIKNHYSTDKENVSVIPYGIEPAGDRSHLDEMSQKSQRMLFAGQYLPRKGSHVLEGALPEVAVRYPSASMTFVVPEDSLKEIEARYRPHFGERLTVLPWTTREKLAEVYSSHNILLFPSYFEGFGKVFLEAMAAGLCVIGFREGGLPDLATHARDALLCETGDRHAYRILIECALSNSKWVREIGCRARETARHYTWERNAIATENFCLSLRGTRLKTRTLTPVPH